MNIIEVLNLSDVEVNRAVLLYAAVMYVEKEKPAPDWIRCISNMSEINMKQNLPCVLDLAASLIEDELAEVQP